MKLFILLSIILLPSLCFAKSDYKKVSDTEVSISFTTEKVHTYKTTIAELKARKQNLLEHLEMMKERHALEKAEMEQDIANLDEQIAEAKKLGIKE